SAPFDSTTRLSTSVALPPLYSIPPSSVASSSSPSLSSASLSYSPSPECPRSPSLRPSPGLSPRATSFLSLLCLSTWPSPSLGASTYDLSPDSSQTPRWHRHPQRQVHLCHRSRL